MGFAANSLKVALPADLAVDTEVDLCQQRTGGYSLRHASTSACRASIHETARAIVDAAHQTCPYSKATRGNINVTIKPPLTR